MKENLLLLKDSLAPGIAKFINIQLQYRKMCILINQPIQLINTTKKIHSTIKMMPADIKSNKYIGVDPKFNVNDHFTFCIANQSKEVFVIEKVKNTVPQAYIISDLNNEETFRAFHEIE